MGLVQTFLLIHQNNHGSCRQAVSLDRFASDLAVILAIDWLLDRLRTVVNLMSDCFAVVIVDHLCRHRNLPASDQVYSQLEMT